MTHPSFEHLLTDEHRMIRDAARDFAQKEITPIAANLSFLWSISVVPYCHPFDKLNPLTACWI